MSRVTCYFPESFSLRPINQASPVNQALIDQIDALLPQTQCTRCGYDDCLAYAEAVAAGEARINRCPPGGAPTIARLADLIGCDPLPLDPECGRDSARTVAVVDEAWCIGCRLCIEACPVDAIVGAARRMHTVIGSECTGCELCVEPCPVDCIRMVPAESGPRTAKEWLKSRAQTARRRYRLRQRRLQKERDARSRRKRGGARRAPPLAERKAEIAAAVSRVNRRRASRPPVGTR